MRIRLLGSAAGGGVPQWNCNCAICREARAGKGRVLPRSQSSVAISADEQRWFLLNASPDTVKKHAANLYAKLGVPTRTSAARCALSVLLANA